MVRAYDVKATGTAANGQTWAWSVTLTAEFIELFDTALQRCFEDLTEGRVQFGRPGVGCQGPYEITRFEIKRA